MPTLDHDVDATIPGSPRERYQGRIALEDAELVFSATPAAPEDKPEVFRWPLPRLTDGPEGIGLRVMPMMGGHTLIRLGSLERMAHLVVKNVHPAAIEAELTQRGVPAGISELTAGAENLRSLRAWGMLYALIGMGNPDIVGVGMLALGGWAALGRPQATMVLGSAVLLFALGVQSMMNEGIGFWAALLGLLSFSSLRSWLALRPLVGDPARGAWLAARVEMPRTEAEGAPAGYMARLAAFFLSVIAGGVCALMALLALTSGLAPATFSAVFAAVAGWYLLVCVYPVRAAALARRVYPASGPLAVILLPLVLGLCALALMGRYLPAVTPSP